MSRPVLVLRPEPGNAATVARGLAVGLEMVPVPLFRLTAADWSVADPDRYTGLLLTSANAVRMAGDRLAALTHLPLFAVGPATATAAEAAGFASIVTGERDVAWILSRIATLGQHRILHLAGEDVTEVDTTGLSIDRVTVYRSEAVGPDADFHTALEAHPIALLHSPRAARHLASLVPEKRGVALVAISDATAAAAGTGWEEVAVAAEPRDGAMLECAARLCGVRTKGSQ